MSRKNQEQGKREKKQATSIFAAFKRDTKTNHRTGYHKPIKNRTTNYPKDGHKAFCARCRAYNGGCPMTGKSAPSRSCSL